MKNLIIRNLPEWCNIEKTQESISGQEACYLDKALWLLQMSWAANSPLHPGGWGAGEMPCPVAPITIWLQQNPSSFSTDWNMGSLADKTLSFQPAEPATEIQVDLNFSIPHEPTFRLGFITWGPLVLFCTNTSIKSLWSPLIRPVSGAWAEM